MLRLLPLDGVHSRGDVSLAHVPHPAGVGHAHRLVVGVRRGERLGVVGGGVPQLRRESFRQTSSHECAGSSHSVRPGDTRHMQLRS
jgi:hypothetical protein